MAITRWISTSSGDFTANANWSSGTAPGAGDTAVFDGTGTAAVTTNLNQSAVAFAAIIIYQANAVQIGTITAGVAAYLQHAAPLVYIGQRTGATGSPSGSQLLLLASGATTCTYAIYDSANSSAGNVYLPPIQITGSAVTIDMSGGSAGLAVRAGETATATIAMAKGGALTVPTPTLYLGPGVTTTAIKMDFGNTLSAVTNTVASAIINGGTYEYQGSGAHTALGVNGSATCFYSGTGTITALTCAGKFDRTRDGRTVTITNTTLYKGASYLLDNGSSGSTVRTNPPVLSGCSMQDVTFSSPTGDLI